MEEKLEIQHGLEKEKKLLDLFGYSLIGPNNSNRWLILDENNNIVGFTQYKKFYNGNKQKGLSKIFGYHTFINSSKIKCEFKREANDKNGNAIQDIDYSYSIDIKRDNGETDNVEMNMGELPGLTIWSEEYGFINFAIGYNGLYLNFKSKTDNFNLEEILIYKNFTNSQDKKEYTYQLRYCKKGKKLSDMNSKGKTIQEISGDYLPYYHDKNQIRITEKTWVNGVSIEDRRNDVEGTIEEMVLKHQMGIDCFNHFRFLINKIIPTQKDIISSMIDEDMINKTNLSLFMPIDDKEEIKKLRK